MAKEPLLINGDSLRIIDSFEDNAFDVIITDPPYNISSTKKLTKVGNYFRHTEDAWGGQFKDSWVSIEEYVDWLTLAFAKFGNKLKPTGSILLFVDRNYSSLIIRKFEVELKYRFRNKLYFIKNNPVPSPSRRNYRSTVEECLWFTKENNSGYTLNFISQREMKQVFYGNIGKKETKHPNEKYEWMIEPLVIRHTNEDDLILDPFAGAASIGYVANKLNRNYVGIEKNKDFFEMGKKRLFGTFSN